ncbi:MAG: alanine racemase [Gammaproteobacteria bacterium]
MTRPARARIDLQALQHNFARVRQAAPHSRTIAILKANAYGHGLVSCARALPDADAFGVVTLDEAITLREAGFDRRIILLEGFFSHADLHLVSGYSMDSVLHHISQVELLEQGPLTRPLDVWVKVDTGMHRLGFAPDSIADLVARLRNIRHVNTIRFLTHFASADEQDNDSTRRQLACFQESLKSIAGDRSLANSAAVLAWPDTHTDWVRPGIMLYGGSPLAGRSAQELGLRPVMTLGTQLIAVNQRKKGDAVGYGGNWLCPQDMSIGVAAIGYGDGYPRHVPAGTPVLVNNKPVPLVGRVSMDMVCLDLSSQPKAAVRDAVVLWGEGLPVDEVASAAGTISYELLCSVNSRVEFEYVG